MRNLKRALSLALAAVMILGMMVIGAGAANVYDSFPDKDEIVNKDAVSMLTTLGIINGEESGKFNPTGDVTRSQMAKMISVIMNKGADNNALYADVNSGLSDISSNWAKGHINFCFTRNIIAGRGNGKFDPEAKVTASEAAKMLLVAAGYDPAKEGFTGGDWAVNVSAMASKLGVYNNYEKSTMEPLSRDDAALLIYNALDVEMIQKYDSNYPINFADHRTILSVMYGVYKMEGVVISNEEAALNGTDYEEAAPAGKTILENVKIYASTTENTTTGEYEAVKGQVTLNTSTTADMLGKTATLYVKKTTILSNSTVLGVFLRDDNNVVKTTTESQDTMKDFLKNTGMSVDSDTKYYVNYGYMANESAATKAMGFQGGDRFTSVSDKTNGSGVDMTVIDNDNDGKVEYVLYKQETLTQVVATNANKETTTLNDFNKNKAIDNDKIVTDETLAEGDVVLTTTYGGKYYVSAPEVITGKMDSFSSSKTKEQYIEVGGTKYYPSYDKFSADSANNTYVFNVLNCGKTDGVDFDIDYDFLLDSAGTVIAYRPSEKSLYNYALILDSGYDPGRTNSNPNGEVKVLLPDGTEGTYTLNFTASAQNIGDQLFPSLTSTQRKDNGIEELKGFLGSSVTDNTNTKPDGILPNAYGSPSTTAAHYSDSTGTKAGHADGYVVGYSLNDNKVLTITSIVGSNNTGISHYNPTNNENPKSVDSVLSGDYDTGSARVKYGAGDNYYTIDQNTVAYYYTKVKGDTVYGVAVGYSKMADVDKGVDFVGATVKKSDRLMGTILFDAEGVVAEKDYAYVLSRSSTISGYITLNVVLMDGTASTLKVERSDWDAITDAHGDNAYNTVYAFTTKNDVSEVTWGLDEKAEEGYVVKLRDGTVALYAKNSGGTVGAERNVYSYSKNIWNVESIAVGDNAPAGAFAENVYKDTILILDAKKNTVRAAFIKSVFDGQVDGGHDFDWNMTNYKTLYAYHTVADMHKAFDEGYNVLMRGDFTLNANLYIPAGKIVYVDGAFNETNGVNSYHVSGGGKLWVKGNYTVSGDINVDTQIGNTSGDLILNAANVTVYSTVAINGGVDTNGKTTKNLTINKDASLYASNNVNLYGGSLTINGHIEANDYNTGNIVVDNTKTLIARGDVKAANLTIGSAANGNMTVAGNLDVGGKLFVKSGSTLTLSKSGATFKAGSLDVKGTLNMSAIDATVTNDATIDGTMAAKSLTSSTGDIAINGKVTATGEIKANTANKNVTLGAGSELSASKVVVSGTGTVVNNGGKLTTTDKTAPVTASGKLSGEVAGDLTLGTSTNSVESGKTLTVNGKLDNTNAIAVNGTLVANGEVSNIANITGAKDAKVIFGAKADVKGTNTTFVYADGTAVANADMAGKTFNYDTSKNTFVYSANAAATADITFALKTPAADANNSVSTTQSAKTVAVNVQNGTTEVVLTATLASGQSIAVTGTGAKVEKDGKTITISDVSASPKVTVTEPGKTDITYTIKVTVSSTPVPTGELELTFANTGDYKVFAGTSDTALTETSGRVGVKVTVPAGTETVSIQHKTPKAVGEHWLVNDVAYTVGSDKCVKVNVSDLAKIGDSVDLSAIMGAQVFLLTVPADVTVTAKTGSTMYKDASDKGAYFKSGATATLGALAGTYYTTDMADASKFVAVSSKDVTMTADTTVTDGYYKVTGVADQTTGAVISSATVGKYTFKTEGDATAVKTDSKDFYVKADTKLTVTVIWTGTTITATKDTVTVMATSSNQSAGKVLEYAAGDWANAEGNTKTVEISAFTGDSTVTITGAHVTP